MCIRPGYALRPAASWTYADCVQQAGLRPLRFCVEAGVHVGALDRKGREQRVRYCLRPAIAHERLSILKDGSVAYLCKDPNRGRSHRIMQHGVLAPGAPWRKHIVPASVLDDAGCSHHAATKTSEPARKVERPRKPTGDVSLLHTSLEASEPTAGKPPWRSSTSYVPWAELLRHCFQQDVLDCPRCHARLEPIAVLRRHDVIERILRHLALPLGPTALGHPDTIAFDVIGEPMPGWVTGVDPEPPDAAERAPPSDWDCVDPAAPDD